MSDSNSEIKWFKEFGGGTVNVQPVSRRRLLLGAAAAAAAGGVALCAGDASAASSGAIANTKADDIIRAKVKGRKIKVGFTPPILSEFFNIMEHACWRKAQELTDRYGVEWDWQRASPAGNFNAVEGQYNILENWIAGGVNAIFVCTAGNFQDTQKIYAKAKAKGVSIIQFNMPVELWPIDQVNAVSSVGYDNIIQSGYAAGRYIAEKLGGKGRILQIWGPSGSTWSEARQRGLDLVLKQYPELKVVGKADGGYVRDKGFAAAQNLLTRHPDVNAIYGENEEMALGASQALSSQGLKHWDGKAGVITIGADGLKSGFQAIREGRLTATIDVGAVGQGLQLMETLFEHHVVGRNVGRVYNVPTTVVTKENVDISDALSTWALGAKNPKV